MSQNLQQDLSNLRNQLKLLRKEIPSKERDRGALLIRGRLFTWLATNRTALAAAGKADIRHIAAFWAMPDEPSLQALLRQWAQDNQLKISLPVVTGPDQLLSWRQWHNDIVMQTGKFNIQEPSGNNLAKDDLPDVVLVPTLGFTRNGDRLGYGGGFYDRTLSNWKNLGHKFVTIGIAWASGDLSNYNYQAASHDFRLDSILTDKGWALSAKDLDLFF